MLTKEEEEVAIQATLCDKNKYISLDGRGSPALEVARVRGLDASRLVNSNGDSLDWALDNILREISNHFGFGTASEYCRKLHNNPHWWHGRRFKWKN